MIILVEPTNRKCLTLGITGIWVWPNKGDIWGFKQKMMTWSLLSIEMHMLWCHHQARTALNWPTNMEIWTTNISEDFEDMWCKGITKQQSCSQRTCRFTSNQRGDYTKKPADRFKRQKWWFNHRKCEFHFSHTIINPSPRFWAGRW